MIDISIVVIYLVASLMVGLYNRSKVSTMGSYSHIGKDLSSNKYILMATIFASAVGGGTTFGITEKAYLGNLAFAYGLILTIPVDLAIAKYLVPKLSKYSGVSSVGEIIGKHYGKGPRIITGIAAALISIGYLSVQINISGRIFSYMFGIEYVHAVIASYTIVIIYTTIGGFRSVVINNTIQFIAMILAIPALAILGIKYIGYDEFSSAVSLYEYNVFNSKQLSANTIFAVLSFSVMGFYPSFIQRILAGKNAKPVQSAIYLKSMIYAIFIICLCANGILASILVPKAGASDAVMALVNEIIPIGFKGFIVVGLLSAVMSTADSDLNIAAISLVNDVLKPLGFTKQNKILLITKFLTVLIGSSVLLIVMKFDGIVELVIFSAGLWVPVAAIPLVALLFGKILKDRDFYISAMIGSTVFFLLQIFFSNNNLSSIFVATIFSSSYFLLSNALNKN